MYVTEVTATSPLASSGGTTPNISVLTGEVSGNYLTGDMVAAGSQQAVSAHIGWFNVKDDYGAVGDGSTDDTSAIQSAIDDAYSADVAGTPRCGIVFFPPGSYVVTAPLTVETTDGGGLVFLGSGGQAPPSDTENQGSQIIADFTDYTPGDVFQISVKGGGGGVTFRDLSVDRVRAQSAGSTFNFLFVVNACVTNVSTQWDYTVFNFGDNTGSNDVNQVFLYGNQFTNVTNQFFSWLGIKGGNLHIFHNAIGGNETAQAAGTNLVGQFDFSSESGGIDPFIFRHNAIQGFAGGIVFDNDQGNLYDFWIENNTFDLGNDATLPCFQATASGSATVHEGHINHNLMIVGNSLQVSPNAIHLDAVGAHSSQVAGIHMIDNVFGGGTDTEGHANGAAIHIANGAADLTVVGGRANCEENAIEIVGNAGTTDGITIVAFGANLPTNGYNVSSSLSANARGLLIQPSSVATPAAPTLSSPTSGGSLAAGVYKVSVTYVNAAGDETLNSGDTSITVTTDQKFTVDSPSSSSGAVSYNVYLSTAGGATSTEEKQTTSPVTLGTNFVVTSRITGSSRPASSSAFMTVQNITVSGSNLTACTTHGLVVDSSLGGEINGVSVVGNSFWGYESPGTAVNVVGTGSENVHISSNPGYNPVGHTNSPPTIAAGPTLNPFPQSARITVISGTITSIEITGASGGSPVSTGLVPTADGAYVELGVGESISLTGTIDEADSWIWFLT